MTRKRKAGANEMNRYLDNELSYLSVDVEKTKSFFSCPQPVRVSQLCQGNPPLKNLLVLSLGTSVSFSNTRNKT